MPEGGHPTIEVCPCIEIDIPCTVEGSLDSNLVIPGGMVFCLGIRSDTDDTVCIHISIYTFKQVFMGTERDAALLIGPDVLQKRTFINIDQIVVGMLSIGTGSTALEKTSSKRQDGVVHMRFSIRFIALLTGGQYLCMLADIDCCRLCDGFFRNIARSCCNAADYAMYTVLILAALVGIKLILRFHIDGIGSNLGIVGDLDLRCTLHLNLGRDPGHINCTAMTGKCF